MSRTEKSIGTLIFPQDYLHELNQVAGVTSEHIVFLKRKFVSTSGWELVKFPLSDCREVEYAQELPFTRIVGGGLLCLLIASILVALFVYGGELKAGTTIPIIALASAAAYGVRAAFSGKRHRLKFKMLDGSTLSWKSRAGERQLMNDSVNAIIEFARSKALLFA